MDALGAFSMWRMQEVLFRMSLKSEPTSTVRDLDQGHVIPNMAPPNWRGIWYPTGFDTDIRDERSSADPDVSAWRPLRTSPAELYGLAMQRSWRRGGDRLLWPAGSAPGSRSASAGVVLRRSELLRVAPFCWSGRIAAGQPKWLGFMACKRSGVRIPVAPQVRRIIRTDRTLSTAAEYSNAGRSAAARQFGYGLRAE